jgi:thiamine monophosphate synthase
MNRTTIGEVIARGVEGVAVVSAIVAAESPRDASEELADIIRKQRTHLNPPCEGGLADIVAM